MQQVDTHYGRLRVPDAEQDIIGGSLRVYGEWAWLETCFLADVLQPGARVLDVGAFVGTFTLGLAAQQELAFVCAVEANPRVASLLSDNLASCLAVPHVVVADAVAPPGTQLGPGHAQAGNAGSYSFASGEAGPDQAGETSQTSLVELRNSHGPFDLVKLDVEGMELDLLRSDEEGLRLGTAVWVECNEDPRSLQVAELMLSWQAPLYYFAWPAHHPDNANGTTEELWPFAYEAGLLSTSATGLVLTSALAAAGCVLTRVDDVEQLRRVMWRTPRWAPLHWAGLSLREVVAEAGHAQLQHSYDDYLTNGWQVGEVGARERELQEALQRAEALATIRLEDLQAAEQRLAALERELHTAETLAVNRLAEVQELQRRAARAEARAASMQLGWPLT